MVGSRICVPSLCPKVGSKGWVQRLGPKARSQGFVPSLGPDAFPQGIVLFLCSGHKVNFKCWVLRSGLMVGFQC